MYGMPGKQVGCPTKVVWLIALFSNSMHFFIQHFVGCQPADTIWWWAKVISFMRLHIIMSSTIDLK